jgi:lysophospholipase L1-like esterase
MPRQWWKMLPVIILGIPCLGFSLILLFQGHRTPVEQYVSPADFTRKLAAGMQEPSRALFLGDSYTEGTGSDRKQGAFVWRVAEMMGWTPTIDGQGGTGYISIGPQHMGPRHAIGDRVVPDTADFDYDYVVIAAGLNDSERGNSRQEVEEAALTAFRAVRQAEPQAQLIVIGPFCAGSWVSESAHLVRAGVMAAAKESDALYLDPVGGRWLTGRKGDNNGNAEKYMSIDGANLNQAGHDYIAKKIVQEITKAGISPVAAL